MRSLAALAVAAALLAGGSLTSVASSHAAPHRSASSVHTWFVPTGLHGLGHLQAREMVLSSDSPSDDTATPTGTPLPTPTPTSNPNFPDAVSVLDKMAAVIEAVTSVHFQDIALQTGSVDLSVNAIGDAVCTGLGVQAKVTAKSSVPGTSQSQTTKFEMIRVKNKDFWKDSKHTHGTWQPTKEKNISPFGFTVDNPLPCPNNTGGTGGGSGSGQGPVDQLETPVNEGEETYNGCDVWHIHAIDLQLDPTTNQTTELPLDWYVDKVHSLLCGYVISFNDQANSVSGSLTTKLKKFGEKKKIVKPVKGSKTP